MDQAGDVEGHGAAARPPWKRRTPGEHRWPVAVAVALAIGLQMVLPNPVVPQARYVLPVLEFVVLLGLIAVNPFRIDRESAALRMASLALTGLVVLANAWSVVLLVGELASGRSAPAIELLLGGGEIWVINMLAFALVYWELDRGGPAARAHGVADLPDFLFVQMQSPDFAPRDWKPAFVDYVYLSFTNATAFSPTDVMPLSRWAKLTMLVQAAVALVIVVLVVARAINVLS